MITAPLPRASPLGTGRLSMIIPRYYGLTITYMYMSRKMRGTLEAKCHILRRHRGTRALVTA